MRSTETVEGTVSESNPLTVTFTLGKAYANAKVTVYVQHNDGSKETLNLTADNNGNVNLIRSPSSPPTPSWLRRPLLALLPPTTVLSPRLPV